MPCAPPYNILLPLPSALRESCICSNHPIPTPTIATLELLPASHLSPSMCTCTCTHYVCVASRRCALGRDQTRGQWRPWQNCAASPVSRRAKLSQRRATCCVTVWPDASPHTAVLGHTGEYWRILADTALVLPTYCDTPRLDIPKYDAVHQYPYSGRRPAYLHTS